MNTENLNGILAQYIQYCKTRTAAEDGTVWRAADCFGVNWDIEDSDFPGMFADAMQQAQLALDNPALQPIGGVQTLMLRETEVELVRECFRWLFKEDDGDICQAPRPAPSCLPTRSTAGSVACSRGCPKSHDEHGQRGVFPEPVGTPRQLFL